MRRVLLLLDWADSKIAGAILVWLGLLLVGWAQVPSVLQQSLPAPALGFGSSVAISGRLMAVGAPDAETVFIYDVDAAGPAVALATIENPNPGETDRFGATVALSGSNLVIGAPLEDTGETDAGSVYVYDLANPANPSPITVLRNPTPQVGDQFGSALAVSGALVVVGTPADEAGQPDAGSAYVFDLSAGDPSNVAYTLRNPTPEVNERFGFSVAISGRKVVVGTVAAEVGATPSGAVYVYNLGGATPTQSVLVLNDPNPSVGGAFGSAVAISDERVVVAATGDDTNANDGGRVYVYDLASGRPGVAVRAIAKPNAQDGDRFGSTLVIAGSLVAVGSADDTAGAGAVYLYDLGDDVSTEPAATLHKLSPENDERFGTALAADGERVVVGTPFSISKAIDLGGAYVFVKPFAAEPTEFARTLMSVGAEFGGSMAAGERYLAVGAPGDSAVASQAGRVAVFDLEGGAPSSPVATLRNPRALEQGRFGSAVAVSGALIAVGEPQNSEDAAGSGAVYVYDLAGTDPTAAILVVRNPSPAVGDLFGSAVAISGTRMAVGAFQDDSGALDTGIVYVYDLSGSNASTPILTIANPQPGAAGSLFGRSVALAGSTLVVGAPGDDLDGNGAGVAYVFDLSVTEPGTPALVLHNPAPATEGQFGATVGLSSGRIVITAPGNSAGAPVSGAAYIFDLGGDSPADVAVALQDPDPSTDGLFGASAAIEGQRVLVGAVTDSGASARGLLFNLGAPAPSNPVGTLVRPGARVADQFGAAVALSGLRAFVGAPLGEGNPSYAGAVYAYGSNAVPGISIRGDGGSSFSDGRSVVDFGAVALGNTSAVRSFTVRNTGVGDLKNLAIELTGADAEDFQVDRSTLLTALATGRETTFSITFRPSSLGAKRVGLRVHSNVTGARNPFDIELAARGGYDRYFLSSRDPSIGLNVLQGRPRDRITGILSATGGTATVVNGKVRFVPSSPGGAGVFSYSAVNASGQRYLETVAVYAPLDAGQSFVGLFRDQANVARGILTFLPSLSGTGTGSVRIDGVSYGFRATLQGISAVTGIPGRVSLSMQAGPPDENNAPTFRFAAADGTLVCVAKLAAYKDSQPAPQAGRYTLVARRTGADPEIAAMLGVNVQNRGTVTLTGRLGDGSAITASTAMVEGGRAPLFIGKRANGRIETLSNELAFGNGSSVDGVLQWRVPAGLDPRLVGGVDAAYEVSGARYTPSATIAGTLPLNRTRTFTIESAGEVTRRGVFLSGTGYENYVNRGVRLHSIALLRPGFSRPFLGGSIQVDQGTFSLGGVALGGTSYFGVILQGNGYGYGLGLVQQSGTLKTFELRSRP